MRAYAQVVTSIWNDPDFCARSAGAQRTYFMLFSQAEINAAGILPLTTKRWALTVKPSERKNQSNWLSELVTENFIVIDEGTEELLVRSFIKWDRGYTNRKRVPVILDGLRAVRSPKLLTVLLNEARRLELDVSAVFPQVNTLSDSLSDTPSDTASDTPSDRQYQNDRVVVTEVGSTHNPSSFFHNPSSRNRSTSEPAPRRKPETTMPDDWHPKQIHHDHAKPGIDVTVEELKFRAWTQANDRRYRNWDAGFTVWLGNARPVQYSTQRAGPQMSTGEQRALVPLEIARRLEAEENNHHRQIGNGS